MKCEMVSINLPTKKKQSKFSTLSLLLPAAILMSTFYFQKKTKTSKQHASLLSSEINTDSLNKFALDLFSELALEEHDVVLSPASIATALSMVQAGTTPESKAHVEFVSTLGKQPLKTLVRDSQDTNVEFVMANSAWLKQTILPQYSKMVKDHYQATVAPLPESVDPINSWVEKSTHGKIPSIINQIQPNTLAILINAVYFKASWKKSFDPQQTRPDQPFYGSRGRQYGEGQIVTKVNMMQIRKSKFPYAEYPLKGKTKVQVVKLPYGEKDEFNAVVMLPSEDGTIDQIISELTPHLWNSWNKGLMLDDIGLSMPRFKLEYGVKSLKSALNKMGLRAVFESQSDDPQLLNMTPEKDAYLDDVLHKATIECSEEGTTATAATAMIVMKRSLDLYPKVHLNRPFLFSIVQNDQILFMARVDNPVGITES
mmetsp:Transcript_30574/g.43393  ORF Transcript_30574/g.43393 Transcript_30574/m.43393 type:complete len:427 (+) Transcript_30574:3-1283(+)